MTDIEPGTRWAEQHTRDFLERRDAKRGSDALEDAAEFLRRDAEERFNDPDPYFEEDGIVEVIATSHTHIFDWVERCRFCDKSPSYYRTERVETTGDVL